MARVRYLILEKTGRIDFGKQLSLGSASNVALMYEILGRIYGAIWVAAMLGQ